MRVLLSLVLASWLVVACCSSDGSSTVTTYESVQELGLRNMNTPLPGVVTAGQITPDQLEELVRKGYENIITLRQAHEGGTGWEEDRARQLGVRFVRIPVDFAAGLDLANAKKLHHALKESGDAATVVYCGSSNRVGALFACRARWLQGQSKEEALSLGQAAGATRYVEHIKRVLEIQ